METGKTYFDFKNHYQINLNGSDKRQKEPFIEYFVMNKDGLIFSDKLKIVEIDVVKFYEICYNNGDLKNLSEFEKLMGLLGCKTEDEEKFFEDEKGMIKTIMKRAEKFRDDSEMIEMYDRDTMLEHMKRKELNDALAKNTEEVTKEVTEKVTKKVTADTTRNIALNFINKGIDLETIASSTGLSIEELNNL